MKTTYTVYTERETYFDVRDIDDLVRMRGNKDDVSRTVRVYDDYAETFISKSEELCYDKSET
jgi:hypothetical protein